MTPSDTEGRADADDYESIHGPDCLARAEAKRVAGRVTADIEARLRRQGKAAQKSLDEANRYMGVAKLEEVARFAKCPTCRRHDGTEAGPMRDDGETCVRCNGTARMPFAGGGTYWPCSDCGGTGHKRADCPDAFHATLSALERQKEGPR